MYGLFLIRLHGYVLLYARVRLNSLQNSRPKIKLCHGSDVIAGDLDIHSSEHLLRTYCGYGIAEILVLLGETDLWK